MKKIIRILIIHSARDLLRYKSFFLLVFALIIADRLIKQYVKPKQAWMGSPDFTELGYGLAIFVFEEMPGLLMNALTDYRTFLVIAGLFLFKQIISIWPSSDMRRMHRKERGAFGIISSLLIIRWHQVLWDAIAVGTICGITGLWCMLSYGLSRMFWQTHQSPVWLLLLLALVFPSLPLIMAGLSFSSKLAVISRGTFMEKLGLFYKLFMDWTIFWQSWIFFLARIVIEALFVVAIPFLIIWSMDIAWLRILLAGMLATPVYSYLKMVTFKFFLEVYKGYDLVREEYAVYYNSDRRLH
jgi:hypothetical protein